MLPRLVSSRKLHAGKIRGDDGRARDTRRCCLWLSGLNSANGVGPFGGNGAVKENVCDVGT